MRNTLLTVFILTGFLFASYGQNENKQNNSDKTSLKDKIIFGGDLALGFGDITFINLSPRAGYKLNPRLLAGAGISYSYYRNRFFEDLEFSNYGGLLFAQYQVLDDFMLMGEYHHLSVQGLSPLNFARIRQPVDILFLGAGYRIRLGRSSFGYVSLMYDVLEDPFSPYSNPYFGGGFMMGLN